jgi:hypothetical protein
MFTFRAECRGFEKGAVFEQCAPLSGESFKQASLRLVTWVYRGFYISDAIAVES